jgi:hypothetical protein
MLEGFFVSAGRPLFNVEQHGHQLFCEFEMPRGLIEGPRALRARAATLAAALITRVRPLVIGAGSSRPRTFAGAGGAAGLLARAAAGVGCVA